ncbi:MAG TPA: MFS transporter [Candidatus Angelobacter sp.]|nr:MFS transporter [Candidatus Angelobacter sp.]
MDHSPSAQVTPVHHSALSPLREPLFRSLWIAAVISYTGSWMQNIATGWLMSTLTTSPVLVSLVQVALSVPVFMIALPAGALADMIDRRKFLLVTQTSMVGAAGILGVLTITGAVTPQLLLVFTFLLGVGAVMNDPAWQALTPDLVEGPKLAAAVALNSAGFNIARAVGPALGGLVIATAGNGIAFLLNAVSFFGVILFLYRWKPGERELPPRDSLGSAIGSGLGYARQDRRIKAVLVRTLAFSLFASAFWALLPLIARAYGAEGYGAMLACFGVGALIGAGVLSQIRRKLSLDAVVAAGNIVFAVAVFELVSTQTLVLSSICAAGAGLAWIGNLASLNFVAQAAAPSWVRARVISLYVLALQGGLALGSAVWGVVASQIGIRSTVTVTAVALCCGVLLGPWFRLKESS